MRSSFLKYSIISGMTMGLLACSGGGGGSGGGAGGGSSSMLQASKMTCGGANCIGTGSASLLGTDQVDAMDVSTAVGLYNNFNNTLIPALNGVISIIEEGAAKAGADSCADIQLSSNELQVTVQGQAYDVKASAPEYSTATTGFTGAEQLTKGLFGKTSGVSGSPAIQADVYCGTGKDLDPLVARVLAKKGSDQLNAWYEKGSSNHIRLLMVVKTGTDVYSSWFRTDDGDSFQLVLASGANYYKAVGKKSLGVIRYIEKGGSESCINATSGSSVAANSCSSLPELTSIVVTGVPSTLTKSEFLWGDAIGVTNLREPAYDSAEPK